MTDAPAAFPLAWPLGPPRTIARLEGKFSATVGPEPTQPSRHTVPLTHAAMAALNAAIDLARKALR